MEPKKSDRVITKDNFPSRLEISFVEGDSRQVLVYEKVTWLNEGPAGGLRYGDNPGQAAALFKLVNGNLVLGEVTNVHPNQPLASVPELLQGAIHPSKANIADADTALNILRYLAAEPTCVIIKHRNPSGVAKAPSLLEAFRKAYMADRIAAHGGCIALNRAVDRTTAEALVESHAEVVVAPDYEEGVMALFTGQAHLRVLRIGNMERLENWACRPFIELTSLIDGGLIAQWSFIPATLTRSDCQLASALHKGKEYRIRRQPTPKEWDDLLFGWKIETGVTSNSVIYVKNGVTVGIGSGEQDRISVAEIARDKAYRKLAERLAWDRFGVPFNSMEDPQMRESIWTDAVELHGGLIGACMISDGFFPFPDGVNVGIKEGVTAIMQPGGSVNDFEVIRACNQQNVAMVFTGQRCFKH